jgi:organic radical activating enzyme
MDRLKSVLLIYNNYKKGNRMFKKIYIEITNICNLNCKFCPNTDREKEFMTLENFEEIIKKIYNHTSLVALHVKGEPLLHSQLKVILKILEKYNLKANITTNGTLIKDKLEVIKDSNSVRQINFSIHSMEQNENLNKQYLTNIFKKPQCTSGQDVVIRIGTIIGLDTKKAKQLGQNRIAKVYSAPSEVFINGHKIAKLELNGDDIEIVIPKSVLREENELVIKCGRNLFQTTYIDYDDIEIANLRIEVKERHSFARH